MPRKPAQPWTIKRPGIPVKRAIDLKISFQGDAFKEERVARGLKRRTVALAIPTDPTQIQRWEEGTYKPSLDSLMKVSLLFGVNPFRFFKTNWELAAIGDLHLGAIRASIAELVRAHLGESDAELFLLLHWLPEADKQKLIGRAMAIAEERHPEVEPEKLRNFGNFLVVREADEESPDDEDDPKLGREAIAEGLASGEIQGRAVRVAKRRRKGKPPEHPRDSEQTSSSEKDPKEK